MPQKRVLLVARYLDVAEAAGDFEAVKQWFATSGYPDSFDAVIVGRKASGEPRIYEHSGTGYDRDSGAGIPDRCALSVAMLLSLAPDTGVGGAMGDPTSDQSLVLAGAVSRAAGRDDLKALGEFLDNSDAAMVLAADAAVAAPVRGVLSFVGSSIEAEVTL